MRRTIPLLLCSGAGFVLVVAHFFPKAETWGENVTQWFNILAAVAMILGGLNLMKVQIQKIVARKAGWGYAALIAGAFVVTLVVGMLKVGVPPSDLAPDRLWSGKYDHPESAFQWIFDWIIAPLQSTMFAMLAFFVSSAAFRAFRAKNPEAMLLLGTALIVLLGRTYAGIYLTDWFAHDADGTYGMLRLDRFTESIVQGIFNTLGMRAISIGIALGVVATSLRILLGLDRSYLGDD